MRNFIKKYYDCLSTVGYIIILLFFIAIYVGKILPSLISQNTYSFEVTALLVIINLAMLLFAIFLCGKRIFIHMQRLIKK